MTLVLLVGQDDAGAGLLGGFLSLMCLFWAIGLAAEVFWLWMLIDALANEPTTNEKILWFLVIFFLNILGAIIYFGIRRSGRSRTVV